jgi:opacity protein-like surface antigen
MPRIHVALLASLLVSVAAPAAAQEPADKLRIYGGAAIGVGGQISTENDDDDLPEVEDEDMIATYGIGAGIEIPLASLFTLGGEMDLSWWNTEARSDPPAGGQEFDRHFQLDVLARPKLRFKVSSLELYGVVPVGITYFSPSSDTKGSFEGFEVEAEGGFGVAVGFGAGATYFVHEHVGLGAELGYLYRRFGGSVKVSDGFDSETFDQTLSFGQVQLRAGATIAF